jgi:hypothetical protein
MGLQQKGYLMKCLVIIATLYFAAPLSAQQPPDPETCRKRVEARQLDFWVGTWAVHRPTDNLRVGTNVIEKILNDCALRENWTSVRGNKGQSVNFFDPQRKTWRQVWVDDTGNVIDYRAGVFQNNAMNFIGITIDQKGDTTHQRLVFVRVAADTVRQIFEASKDGKTWNKTWEGIYIREK